MWEKWVPEVNHFKRPRDAIFLLGLKKDLRHDPLTLEYLKSKREPQVPVTEKEGQRLAKKMGAVKYFECSAKTREGAHEVFDTILSMVLEASPELKARYKGGEWKHSRSKKKL